jgi:hypothetical protein
MKYMPQTDASVPFPLAWFAAQNGGYTIPADAPATPVPVRGVLHITAAGGKKQALPYQWSLMWGNEVRQGCFGPSGFCWGGAGAGARGRGLRRASLARRQPVALLGALLDSPPLRCRALCL